MDGEFVPWADAKLHVLTHGLHYASAVFEGERAYGGVIFKLDDHTRRLHESAQHPRLRDSLFGRGDQQGLPRAARAARAMPTPMSARSPGAAAR